MIFLKIFKNLQRLLKKWRFFVYLKIFENFQKINRDPYDFFKSNK